jgi:hypothetical protein
MDKKKRKKTICVDFDGVLNSYKSGWTGIDSIVDKPVEGAMEFLINLVFDDRFDVCIYSSRSKSFFGRLAMKRWLKDQLVKEFDIEYNCKKGWPDYLRKLIVLNTSVMDPFYIMVEDCTKAFVKKLKFPTKKPAAFITIDDRAICFTGEFPDIEFINNFKPWNK